ncbi:DDE-type integrase/transposase/recombinase [Pseudomonas fulva]|uniref:Mu transposase C-terminal domain-containing protein n=1 Tax=Pseudomonas TaxID=286 RepID=UPI0003C5EA64|nr:MULTISPECIES: Mu transposase C-terminal domain-containing protein [Pseudomonas]MBH3362337.1 DDE-type integrase/transposase/recombinase [Pseudomonas sp. URMO17WK12:I11]MCY4123736.1 Mu transposase C-terminal domain-containing protein [Pseudomonas sp.]AVF57487.1 transposase [Pseudomonas fulva]EST17270.1 integrase core domain protein [Pseudomonas putida S610]MBN6788958.1 DDE-type integrase/transposase/recombinase [Pseudomonas fulva]
MKTIKVGERAFNSGRELIVLEIIGLDSAIVKYLDTKETKSVLLVDLSINPPGTNQKLISLGAIHKHQWENLRAKFRLLKPLLNSGDKSDADYEAVAKAAGKSVRTIYRWIERYRETELLTGLMRSARSDKGSYNLSTELEEVITEQIDSVYQVLERPSVKALYDAICAECRKRNLQPPHKNTIGKRVANLPPRENDKKRLGVKRAREIYSPLRGSFPGADYPNAVVQIDHTPVDIILVDEEHRLPIGRPHLTLAIDVATKLVTGYYLSLDPPGALSAGLCIAHAVMRKDVWLAKRNIDVEWPIHGKMVKIHVDNAKEFRGQMLTRACDEHDIILEWRPRGQPNYGPQIERAFRTFMSQVHTIPGTTFSNVVKKLDYDSDGKACMTLGEFDHWFAAFISSKYHHSPHKGIDGIAPISMYYRYVHGTDTQLGVGFPAPIEDEDKFRLDFMPFENRSIQKSGVTINHIHYYAPVLRSYIGIKDGASKKSKKYIFAYDPRNLSVIYFYDDEGMAYHPIPYANGSRPAISLWELNACRNRLKDDPSLEIDEDMIFAGYEMMREIEARAIEKTGLAKQQRAADKRKRRMSERRRSWAEAHGASKTVVEVADNHEAAASEDDEVILPFDEIH